MDRDEIKQAVIRALTEGGIEKSPDYGVYLIWWRMHDSASFEHAREILAEAVKAAYQAGRDDVKKLFGE